jgi:hypothetical protein
MESDCKHDRERVERPRLLLFRFAYPHFPWPDRKDRMRREVRMNESGVLVSLILGIMNVLSGREQKGLKHCQT